MNGQPVYAEPARSLRSLSYSVLLIVIGFGIDLLFGVHGAITHLPGWAVFGVVLVGIHALVLHAVRSTHSLTLTADELRIGDEAVQRPDIVGLTDPLDLETHDLPVLGWPNGRPRGVASVIVRLSDDRDVEVPTRYPDRLRSALTVDAAPLRPEASPRPAGPDDLALLADIDARADTIFRIAGYDLPDLPFDEDALAAARAVLVVGDPPVGFAQVDEVDGLAHLQELAVLPSAMRHGMGTRLLEAACAWAAANGYPAITLTTFADVRWNAPFYAARGFVETLATTPDLAHRRADEARDGLDAAGRRIAMRRELG